MTEQWPPGDDSTDPEWEWVGDDGLTDAQREMQFPEPPDRISIPGLP